MIDPQRLRQIVERTRDIPCVRSLGLQVLEADEGYCKISAIHDRNYDGIPGTFHGGMLANVADCVAWFAIATCVGPDEPMVTTDLAVRYVNPCIGDVTASGRVIKIGRTLCPVAVEIFDAAGTLVVAANVCYMRLPLSASGVPKLPSEDA